MFPRALRPTALSATTPQNSGTISLDPSALGPLSDLVKRNCIVIFSKTSCPFCVKAKDVFEAMKVSYRVVEIDEREDGCFLQHTLGILTGSRTVPRVFVNGVCIGGAQQTIDLYKKGELLALIMKCATRCDEKTNKH
uniref:Glutaredoxin-2, mitochondrial n=1 Tax=Callorhinchus milii TaxID=7868 RepID=A0A4W3K4Z3_CALMI